MYIFRLNGDLRCFQQYFSHITATVHMVHVFPGFHQYQAGALKCFAQGHSNEKTQRIQSGSNPGPLEYESNTLPLSHAGAPDIYRTKTDITLIFLEHEYNFCG